MPKNVIRSIRHELLLLRLMNINSEIISSCNIPAGKMQRITLLLNKIRLEPELT